MEDEFTLLNLFGSEEIENKEATISSTKVINDEVVKEEVGKDKIGENTTNNDNEITVVSSDTVTKEGEIDEDTLDNESIEQSDKLDKVFKFQQQLLERLEALDALFNARIMHTEHEEKIIDQMHEELQKYKGDMYAKLTRPILLDVIEVRDSIMRVSAAYLAKPEGEQSIPNKIFSDYAYDLQDILEKNSVEIYRSKSGDDFIPIKQRVIKKVITSDEALHGKVAESLSCGYNYNGRTISAEKITVYFYEKTMKENENSEVMENG